MKITQTITYTKAAWAFFINPMHQCRKQGWESNSLWAT